MKTLDKILDALVRWMVLLDRAKRYVGYASFFMMFYLTLKASNNSPVRAFLFHYWYFVIPVIFVLLLIVGFIEKLLKIREREQANYSKANPEWTELINKINKILENTK
jgi:hypothetical protein